MRELAELGGGGGGGGGGGSVGGGGGGAVGGGGGGSVGVVGGDGRRPQGAGDGVGLIHRLLTGGDAGLPLGVAAPTLAVLGHAQADEVGAGHHLVGAENAL